MLRGHALSVFGGGRGQQRRFSVRHDDRPLPVQFRTSLQEPRCRACVRVPGDCLLDQFRRSASPRHDDPIPAGGNRDDAVLDRHQCLHCCSVQPDSRRGFGRRGSPAGGDCRDGWRDRHRHVRASNSGSNFRHHRCGNDGRHGRDQPPPHPPRLLQIGKPGAVRPVPGRRRLHGRHGLAGIPGWRKPGRRHADHPVRARGADCTGRASQGSVCSCLRRGHRGRAEAFEKRFHSPPCQPSRAASLQPGHPRGRDRP